MRIGFDVDAIDGTCVCSNIPLEIEEWEADVVNLSTGKPRRSIKMQRRCATRMNPHRLITVTIEVEDIK